MTVRKKNGKTRGEGGNRENGGGLREGLLYLDKGIAGRGGSITAKRVFGRAPNTVTILNFAIARNSGFSVETICTLERHSGRRRTEGGGERRIGQRQTAAAAAADRGKRQRGWETPLRINGGMPAGRPLRASAALSPEITHIRERNYFIYIYKLYIIIHINIAGKKNGK